jgi:sulfur-oxidizing protein SoxX
MIRLSMLMVEESRISFAPRRRRLSPMMLVLAFVFSLAGSICGAQGDEAPGKALVMEKSKGNCLACHVIADGEQPGNIGPPLIAMKARFPDSEILYKQIWDATQNNPETRMPPYGRHGILSREEIDLIIEYLYTL